MAAIWSIISEFVHTVVETMAAIWSIITELCAVPSISTLCVFMLTFIIVMLSTRRRPGIPPGPPLIPIVGNLLSLASTDVLGEFRRLRASYGDVYGLYIGSELMICLNGHEVIHEALIKKGSVFSMRPTSGGYKLVVTHKAIVMENGAYWTEQKRTFQTGFKDMLSKRNGRNVEHVILNEVSSLIAKLNEMHGPFVIDSYIQVVAANVICMLLIHQRFELDDEHFLKVLSTISQNANDFSKMLVESNCFPYLHRLPGDLLNMQSFQTKGDYVREFLRPFIKRHQERHIDCVHDDILDSFEERRTTSNDATLNASFTTSELQETCAELLSAGSETTATTIRWLLLYMIRDPTIQEKMYSEISQQIGNTPPSWDDRTSLVYVEAVILEGLRLGCPVPLAIPHATSQDIVFRNYLIPHDATIIVNLDSSLNDPNVWKNPTEFRPERFLNKDATKLTIPREFIPFSLGRRSCMGETLARMELFLFMTFLVQAFEFRSADENLPDIVGVLGITHAPKPFQIRIIKR